MTYVKHMTTIIYSNKKAEKGGMEVYYYKVHILFVKWYNKYNFKAAVMYKDIYYKLQSNHLHNNKTQSHS